MKRSFVLVLLTFSVAAASAQVRKPAKAQSLVAANTLTEADKDVNRRFINNGTTLLNLRGGIPEPRMISRKPTKEQPEINVPAQEKLITRNLLFTGKLSDHISQPLMIYRDSLTAGSPKR